MVLLKAHVQAVVDALMLDGDLALVDLLGRRIQWISTLLFIVEGLPLRVFIFSFFHQFVEPQLLRI